jgi:hypothetical protein
MRQSSDDDDSMRFVRIDPRSAYRGSGASPLLFRSHSWEDEISDMVGMVSSLLEGRWNGRSMPALKAHEIGILYPRACERQKELLETLPEQIHESCGVGAVWQGVATGDANSHVKIETIHASKGLQYRAVIILWAGILPFGNSADDKLENEKFDRRLLYGGMTRAESFLAITASGQSPYVADMADSPACTVIPREKISRPTQMVG